MNHCLLEVEVKKGPTLRYTQDNKTPIAEIEVQFDGLRADDPPGELKVVGWGNLAEELQNRIQVGQRLVIEGRLRMTTVPRQDGSKEKRAEFTLSKLHPLLARSIKQNNKENPEYSTSPPPPEKSNSNTKESQKPLISDSENLSWNSAPLVPDTDDIPF